MPSLRNTQSLKHSVQRLRHILIGHKVVAELEYGPLCKRGWEAGHPCFSSCFRLLMLAFFEFYQKMARGGMGKACDHFTKKKKWSRLSLGIIALDKRPMTQNVPHQTWQAKSSSEVTQQGEICTVISPSPLGCELATGLAPVAWEQSLAPGCRHWQGQAENGLRQRKRRDLASRGKTPVEGGSVHQYWASGHTDTAGKITLECFFRL